MITLGYRSFRSPEQAAVISAVMAGSDVLSVLPTGGGKSACFQLPTIARGHKALVISHLIALMQDQVQKLQARGIAAFAIHSGTTHEERVTAQIMLYGAPSTPAFLYASPEMLLSETFWRQLGRFRPNLIAVDEAHCVSTWGSDFRPSYLRIKEIARRFKEPQCIALSATIDPRIEQDIVGRLPLKKGVYKVIADPYRPNLTVKVEQPGSTRKLVKERTHDARQRLMQLLKQGQTGASIVYCYSRASAAEEYMALLGFAKKYGYRPLLFHAELPREDKDYALEAFLKVPRPLVFATTAFGMGIDRADVRQIIHFDAPYTLVDYAQQIGRAGRDGLPALCTAFYFERRAKTVELRQVRSVPSIDFVERTYARLVRAWTAADFKDEYSLPGFVRQQRLFAGSLETMVDIDLYMARVNQSLGLLKKVGYIDDTAGGLKLLSMKPGLDRHTRLLAETLTAERRHVREAARIGKFFNHPEANQALLWQLLGEE